MVYCPLLGGVGFAALRKLWFRDLLWINVQDIPVEAASASGLIKSARFARLASFAQRFLLNRGDMWSSICPGMVSQLERIKSERVPVHLCPNWLTGALRNEIQQAPDKVGRLPAMPAKLLYCGTVGNKQGLLEFCRQLALSDGDFVFEIRGEGSEVDSVRQWIESQGDRRFQIGHLLPQADFVKAIYEADWFVVPQRSSVGSSFFPSKLIPSISVGTPILAISENSGPLGQEVTENGLGLVVPWDGIDQLVPQLDAFSRDAAGFERFQRNCLRRARVYEREFAIDKIEALMTESCTQSGTQMQTV